MALKLTNVARSVSLQLLTNGADYLLLPNGKKIWFLTTAITANSTADDAVAVGPASGDYAMTSHATGLGSIFRSDGTVWQFLTNS